MKALLSIKKEIVWNITKADQLKKTMNKNDWERISQIDLLNYKNKSWEKFNTYLDEYELLELSLDLQVLYLQISYDIHYEISDIERIKEFVNYAPDCIKKINSEIEATRKIKENKKKKIEDINNSLFHHRILNKFKRLFK